MTTDFKVKRCPQTKCAYHPEHKEEITCLTPMQRSILSEMCPICDECGAEKHIINESCVSCFNCSRDEGVLRKGKPESKEMDAKMIIIPSEVLER